MFERFTDQARRSVVMAQEESRRLRHNHIGPEHVLLGILGAGASPGAVALAEAGFQLDEVRGRIEPGQADADSAGHIPFTANAKRALELSLREALKLDHRYIGPEHLVLGMLEIADFPIESLAPDGFDRATLRAATLRAIAAAPPPEPANPHSISRVNPSRQDPELREIELQLRIARRALDEAIDAHNFDTALVHRAEEIALKARRASAMRRIMDVPPPSMVRGQVYLSYRPEDAEGVAGRLYDALVAALSPDLVGMDAGLTAPGRDPIESLTGAVAPSEFILVLIGPSWLDSRTPDGRRRIDLDDDEVRLTLLAAEGVGHVVIPVLVHQAELPAAFGLPAPVAWLAQLEPVRLRHLSFAADVADLLRRLRPDAAAA